MSHFRRETILMVLFFAVLILGSVLFAIFGARYLK